MDLKAVVVSGEAPESDDDASNIVTVCNIYHCIIFHTECYKFKIINMKTHC